MLTGMAFFGAQPPHQPCARYRPAEVKTSAGRYERLLSNFLLFVRQPPEHHARHGGVEQHLAGLDETLVIAAHAPVSPDPGECPLHHPTPLEHVKAARDLWRRLIGAAPDAV